MSHSVETKNRVVRKDDSNENKLVKKNKLNFNFNFNFNIKIDAEDVLCGNKPTISSEPVTDFSITNFAFPLELINIIFPLIGPSIVILLSQTSTHWRQLCEGGIFGDLGVLDILPNVFETANEYLLDVWGIESLISMSDRTISCILYEKLLFCPAAREIHSNKLFEWAEEIRINKRNLINMWAEHGYLVLLEKALLENKKILQQNSAEELNRKNLYQFHEIMQYAAKGKTGNETLIIEWAIKNIDASHLEDGWDKLACQAASKNGNSVLLKFLIVEKQFACNKSVCANLADRGDLATLEFCRSKGIKWNWDTFHNAACHGNEIMLKYLLDNNCPYDNDLAYVYAVEGNSLSNLKYLVENGFNWGVPTVNAAVSSGHLNILEYLLLNNCPTEESSCITAAYSNNLKALELLRQYGSAWNEKVYEEAAGQGCLEILKYCHDNGCPLNKFRTYLALLSNEYYETLKWNLTNEPHETTEWFTLNVLTKDDLIQITKQIEANPKLLHF